jgi:NitT/TauT family transport system ATP-binding protein
MQQRVSLCRSLIHAPAVMLMDEPFSALDALTRTELSGELQRIQLEQPRTVVFVTHSIEEAVVLADRVAVLTPRPGRLRETVDLAISRPRAPGRPDVDQAGRELRDLLTAPADGGAT